MSETPENIRPWGRYDILDEGPGFKVKRITVSPGKRLSYQSHAKRSERWTVVDGAAHATLDGAAVEAGIGEIIIVPVGCRHRVENLGTAPLTFIEVQIGDYLGEDDIVRYEDDYGRA